MGSDRAALNQSDRRPDFCEFRRIESTSADPQEICGLAERVTGGASPARCRVDRAVCNVCATFPLPDGPRLNPVVASLAYLPAERPPDAAIAQCNQITAHHTRQFALRWLASDPGDNVIAPVDAGNAGVVGLLDAVPSRECRGPPPRRCFEQEHKSRVGLVGRHSPYGLGHVNRDLAVQLDIDRWLVPVAASRDTPPRGLRCRTDVVSSQLSPLELHAWLDGLDVVLFVERPWFTALPEIARRVGVRVVCVPMWEWLHPGLDWLEHVDLMLCPTRHAARFLAEWKERFRFCWEIETLTWPIDTDQFAFRRRHVCQRFVFVYGSGGARAAPADASLADFQRKGLHVLLAAARQMPNVPIIIYAFAKDIPPVPSNIELRSPPEDNSLLYCDGDVCVQPSHWEGLGLPLLECQAAGMPLVTTDAAPMNEHQPLALIPAVEEVAFLTPELCIPAARIRAEQLAGVLRSLHGRRIFSASGRARRYVQGEHSWDVARPKFLRILERLVTIGTSDHGSVA